MAEIVHHDAPPPERELRDRDRKEGILYGREAAEALAKEEGGLREPPESVRERERRRAGMTDEAIEGLSWRARLQEMKYWRIDRPAENLLLWFVGILPREIVYRATIRLWAHGTSGQWGHTSPMELTIDEALKRWQIPSTTPARPWETTPAAGVLEVADESAQSGWEFPRDLLEAAMGLICNVDQGGWQQQPEWMEAASKWLEAHGRATASGAVIFIQPSPEVLEIKEGRQK